MTRQDDDVNQVHDRLRSNIAHAPVPFLFDNIADLCVKNFVLSLKEHLDQLNALLRAGDGDDWEARNFKDNRPIFTAVEVDHFFDHGVYQGC